MQSEDRTKTVLAGGFVKRVDVEGRRKTCTTRKKGERDNAMRKEGARSSADGEV